MIEFINKLCTRILELFVVIPMFFTCLVLTILAFLLYPFKSIRYWFGEQLDRIAYCWHIYITDDREINENDL